MTASQDTPSHERSPLARLEPLAVDAEQAAALLGMSRSMFYKMNESGQIGPMGRRFGKCVRWSVAELRAWAEAGMPPRHEWVAQRLIANR